MSQHSQFRLFAQRRFLPFYLTQFSGAFNDNLYKNALLLLITYGAGDVLGLSVNLIVNLAAFLFILPFFLFSGVAGPGGRPLRDVDHYPPGEAGGNRHHGSGRGRALVRLVGVAAGAAVPDGHSVHLLRTGEVRHPAEGAGRQRTGGGQRPGGHGHLRGDPAGDHCRRSDHGAGPGRPSDRRGGGGDGGGRLPRGPGRYPGRARTTPTWWCVCARCGTRGS